MLTILSATTATIWSEVLTNRIVGAVFLALVMFFFKDIIELLPSIGDCFLLKHGHVQLEHNRSRARSRNQIAWLLSVPYAMMLDRYDVLCAGFFSDIPSGLELPVTYGMLLVFAAIRELLYVFAPSRIRGEEKSAAANSLYTYLIPMTLLMLVTCGILNLSSVPEAPVRTILVVEISVAYFVSLVKTGQIFAGSCGVFSTFLYLCALEIAPAALLVIATIVF